MASGLLTEQEYRIGGASSSSFETNDLFTVSAFRGGAYLAARYGLGVFVSLGNMLVMTRWIGPHAYGLFVTAIGIVAFLSNRHCHHAGAFHISRPLIVGRDIRAAADSLVSRERIRETLLDTVA